MSYWFNKTFVRLAFHRTFLPAKVGSVCHTSKHEGTVGKYREKQGKAVLILALFLCFFSPFYHIRFSRCNTMRIVANKHLPSLHPLRTCPLV